MDPDQAKLTKSMDKHPEFAKLDVGEKIERARVNIKSMSCSLKYLLQNIDILPNEKYMNI